MSTDGHNRRTFLRRVGATAGGAALAAGVPQVAAAEQCEFATHEYSYRGAVSIDQGDTLTYDLHYPGKCSVTVSTVSRDDRENADLDLYLTLDGREPTTSDYDRKSYTYGSDESITVSANELAGSGEVGLLVHAYGGGGKYELTVAEHVGATAANKHQRFKTEIVSEARAIYNGDEGFDCADMFITSAARAAGELDADLSYKVWDVDVDDYVYPELDDYSSVEAFAEAMRIKMGAINLIANSEPTPWSELEPGDLVLYDLRHHDDDSYGGHTMIITERATNDSGETVWKTIEGHLGGGITTGTYTKEELKGKWKGPVDGKGRHFDWDRLSVPDDIGDASKTTESGEESNDGGGGGGGGGSGDDGSFAVSTGSATDVSDTTAILGGTLDDIDGADSATVYFEYRARGSGGWTVAGTRTLSGTSSFNQRVAGLDSETTYEFRVAGRGSDGDVDSGEIRTFTTDSGGWCFVTTATARSPGSLDSLRRFRDDSMSATPLGRGLVGLYYRISPPIAATLERHPESRTARAVRRLVHTCASVSDRQAETDSRAKSTTLGVLLTVLYVVGILVGAAGHAGIAALELFDRA